MSRRGRPAPGGAPALAPPTAIAKPGAAGGAMARPPLGVREPWGLSRGAGRWSARAGAQLQRRRDELLRPGTRAQGLARRIGRTIPLIHGGGAIGATAAQRWKTQVNENPNAPAFWSSQPELCHNEFQGWGQHGDITRQILTLVALRHDGEHPQVMRRFELVTEAMREVVAGVEEVHAEGDGELAQLLDLILIGDFVSLHMAFQEGIDPGPIDALDSLKRRLSGASS